MASFIQSSRFRLIFRVLGIGLFIILLLITLETVRYMIWNFGKSSEREVYDTMIDVSVHDRTAATDLPRIIHQIWMGNRDPPPRYLKCAVSWRNLAKDGKYKYILWNSTSIAALLSRHYPQFLKRWKEYKYNMNRIDTAKYFLLFTFGGIFADMDVCNIPEDPVALIRSSKYLSGTPGAQVLLITGQPVGVNPEYMASPPNHPFLAHALRNLYNSDRFYPFPYLYMMCVGGPCFLTGVYHRYPQPQHILVRTYKETRDKLFGAVKGGEWYSWDSYILISFFYFGIYEGKLLPHWLSILIFSLIIGVSGFLVWRRCRSGRCRLRLTSVKPLD